MTYREQIRSPQWISFATAFKEKHGWRCSSCGVKQGTGNEITVHHIFYSRDCLLWEYPESLLECLCWKCHTERQDAQQILLLDFATHLKGHSTAALKNRTEFWGGMGFDVGLEEPEEADCSIPADAPPDEPEAPKVDYNEIRRQRQEGEYQPVNDLEAYMISVADFSSRFPLQASYLHEGRFGGKDGNAVTIRFERDNHMAAASIGRPCITERIEEILSIYMGQRIRLVVATEGGGK